MLLKSHARYLAIGMSLLAFISNGFAQTTVYTWVDEEGVVHFGDAPPDESVVAETLVIPKAPTAPTAVPPLGGATEATKAGGEDEPAPKAIEAPLLYEKTNISKLSIEDLDLRCDEAREKRIAPLREAEIAKCKQDRREDPAFCEHFNADFGDALRTVSGAMRPRMFDDLPECTEALQEQNRRTR